jgi:shikimate kinase
MRIVVLAGPPCSGKTTLAHRIAQPDDVVLDYDDIARAMGSPVQWIHPEPYLTQAEHEMQAAIHRAHHTPGTGTAWVLRTAPRPAHRARLAQQWDAQVYLLDPGEQECRRRAVEASRPSGTRQSIGLWYHRHTPWVVGDMDPSTLDASFVNVGACRGVVEVDPQTI